MGQLVPLHGGMSKWPTTNPCGQVLHALAGRLAHFSRYVALQVEFERQILKPVFHLIGFRLWV
jgi:hypothetical protein